MLWLGRVTFETYQKLIFKETCHKFLSKINDPKIVTERLKKDIIKLVIDEVVIEGESVKIFATIPLPNKIHEREMDKADIPGTFNAGATLGPINETNMTRIWNKHKQTNTFLKRKVFVAMSGGVDSSVAAALLKKQGYEVVGFFMKNWSETINDDTDCPWTADQEDARKVAAVLGIPIYTFNFEKQYRQKVVEYFLSEYEKGRTPNPDVMCNKEIKFGLFFEKSLKIGADFIATGHYIRISNNATDLKKLYRGIDSNKDQSYFLWTLNQKQLSRCLFPIGEFTKPQIRKIARDFGLPTYNKPDSQGICFMGEFDVWDFLKKRIKAQSGPIMTVNHQVIGEHEGLPFYTIGQRRHIKVGGTGPYYVVEKDFSNNTLVVADNNHSDVLYRKSLIAGQVNWISGQTPKLPCKIEAQIRYRSASASAIIESGDDKYYKIVFDESQRAVTEGQSVVFYIGDEMIGGGVIEKVK